MSILMTRRRLLATAAAVAFAPAPAATAGASADAIAFARSLYALDDYWLSISQDEAAIRRYLDPNLAGLVMGNLAKNDDGALSYDPLLQAQDFDDVRTTFSINTITDKAATVNVVVENFGERLFVILDLSLTDNGWRLTDIRAANASSLVEELTRLNASS